MKRLLGKPTTLLCVGGEMKLSSLAALVAAVLVLLTACAGNDEEAAGAAGSNSAPPQSPPTSTPAGTSSSGPEPNRTNRGEEIPVPPEVDLSLHEVPLEDIHFDTFDGGSITLADSTPELRRRLLDAIPPIDFPVYGDVSAGAWLDPTDLVLGYIAGGDQAYAYPFKILNFHEIVNDELDGVPVLISYCPLCRSGIVYDRRVRGDVLSFGNTSALYESDLVMVDRNSGSYWWQVAGRAIVGPLTGTALEPLPSAVATWEDWIRQHPGTRVLTRDTGFSRPYEQDAFALYEEFLDSGQFPFPVGETARDGRLRPSALVVGVTVDGISRAYPVEGLTGPINDLVGEEPVVVFPIEGGASVFTPLVDGATLQFERRGGDFVDKATGSVWTADGVAVAGAMEGTTLRPLPSRTTFWFALVGAFPDVEVYTD